MDKIDPSIALSSALVSITMDKGGTMSSNNSCDVVVKCSSSKVVVSAASCGASSTSSSNSCSQSSGDDEEDEDDDDCTRSKLHCLHCGAPSSSEVGIQVSCDECNAFLCNNCHWCHEFQANHEIRVCERCDGFFCRKCDEMDQCDSCQEVVCSGCASLLSCKFCGAGMCEECATGCGRCGIVLCERDLKFAVECDTCKLPYCLVCLASAAKEPCVRCGVRQSKRVNQVVHLRLKSIYKAFQQSSSSNNNNKNSSASNFIAAASATTKSSSSSLASSSGISATSTKKRGAAGLLPPDKNVNNNNTNNAAGNPFQYSNSADYYCSSSSTAAPNTNNTSDWGAFFGGDFCRPASTTNHFNNNKIPKEYSCETNTSAFSASENTNTNINRGRYYGERARMMMSVKAACAQAAGAAKNSISNASNKNLKGCDCNASVATSNAAGSTAASSSANAIFNNSSITTPTMYDYHNLSHVANNYSRTDAEADAAAAALLKELEEEEEAKIVQSSKKTANKSKKKKQQNKVINKPQTTASGVASTNINPTTVMLMAEVEDKPNFLQQESNKDAFSNADDKISQQQQTNDKDKGSNSNDDEDSEHEMERTLVSFIDSSDVDGIEAFLASIKGVPGRALLRKNAKKALKRMKEENPDSGTGCHFASENVLPSTASTNALPSSRQPSRKEDDNPDNIIGASQLKLDSSSSKQCVENSSKVKKMEDTVSRVAASTATSANTNAVTSSSKISLPPVSNSKVVATAVPSNFHRPLLKVVKQTTITNNSSNSQSPFSNPNSSHNNKQNQYPGGRAECVMHMSPVIIGWVIGKGGQRIRDIMEEASARIWIDQNENNIQADGYRVVYVSGGKKNVETAIKLLKDLISKAPINNNCNNSSSNPDSNKPASAFSTGTSATSESNKVTTNKSSGSSGPVPATPSQTNTPGIATTSAWGKAASATALASKPMHGPTQAEDSGRSATMIASSPATSLMASRETDASAVEYTQVVQCEPRFVALLIGRRGWTVKHIQDESGARVDIDQTVTPRIIRISGSSENQVNMATQMVRDVLSYPDAQLHYGDSSVSNEKTIHRMLDQQKYNSALITTAHEEQQYLLATLEHPVHGTSLQAIAGAAKANVDSLLPPLPPDAHQELHVNNGKQHGSINESSSSFERSITRQTSSSFLHQAPPPGYAPAVTASLTATPTNVSSMPITPDAVRLERDMRTTTQSVLAGLYSPSDDEKRNAIGPGSSNTKVDSSWPQSALANMNVNKNNSFVNPSLLFKVQDSRNAISNRNEHDTGIALVGGSVWSSQASSSSAYLGLSESRHRPVSMAGSDSPFYESPKINPPTSYQQKQSSLGLQQPMIAASTGTRKYSRMMELFSIPDNAASATQASEESVRRVSLQDKMNYSNASLTSNTIASHSSSSTWTSSNSSASGSAITTVPANCGTSTPTDHLWSSQEPKSLLTTPSSFGLSSQLPFSSGMVVPSLDNDKQNFQSLQPFYSRGTHDGTFINDDSVLFSGINQSTMAARNMNSSVSGFMTSGLQPRISPEVSSGAIASNHNPLWSRGPNNLSSKSLNEGSDNMVSKHDNCGQW